MKKIKIIFVLTLFICTSFNGNSQSSDCWPTFRGNQSLQGKTSAQIPNTLKLLWSFSTQDMIKSSPIICGNHIFVGSNDGYLYSLNSKGELNWKFNAGTSIEAPPLFLDNTVYFGSLEGILFALDATTGSVKWKYTNKMVV